MQMHFYLIKITLNKYALFFNVALCQKLSPTTLNNLPKNLLQWLYDPLLYGYSTICLIPPLLDMWLFPGLFRSSNNITINISVYKSAVLNIPFGELIQKSVCITTISDLGQSGTHMRPYFNFLNTILI